MPLRRHIVNYADSEIGLIDRALRAYHTLLSTQTSARGAAREADQIASVAALVQAHMRSCVCPVPDSIRDLTPDEEDTEGERDA